MYLYSKLVFQWISIIFNSKGLGSPTRCWKLLMLSYDADVKCVYAARCGEEGATARAGQGAPLPAHCLTGALIPAKTLSRRHFVHKVRSACARMQLDEYVCLCLFDVVSLIWTCVFIESHLNASQYTYLQVLIFL